MPPTTAESTARSELSLQRFWLWRSHVKRPARCAFEANELYGDFQKPGQFAAVLSLRFLWFSNAKGSGEKLWLQKDYARRVPLKEATAAALAAGWDQALAETMTQVASDLASARTSRAGP